jgi:hypothetical protein
MEEYIPNVLYLIERGLITCVSGNTETITTPSVSLFQNFEQVRLFSYAIVCFSFFAHSGVQFVIILRSGSNSYDATSLSPESASRCLRKDYECNLIGHITNQIVRAKLSSKRQVFSVLFFNVRVVKLTINKVRL